MVSGAARYDGHSEYYDQHFAPGPRPAEELAFLREALRHDAGVATFTAGLRAPMLTGAPPLALAVAVLAWRHRTTAGGHA